MTTREAPLTRLRFRVQGRQIDSGEVPALEVGGRLELPLALRWVDDPRPTTRPDRFEPVDDDGTYAVCGVHEIGRLFESLTIEGLPTPLVGDVWSEPLRKRDRSTERVAGTVHLLVHEDWHVHFERVEGGRPMWWPLVDLTVRSLTAVSSDQLDGAGPSTSVDRLGPPLEPPLATHVVDATVHAVSRVTYAGSYEPTEVSLEDVLADIDGATCHVCDAPAETASPVAAFEQRLGSFVYLCDICDAAVRAGDVATITARCYPPDISDEDFPARLVAALNAT